MAAILAILALMVLGLGMALAWQRSRHLALERERRIRSFSFPAGVLQQFQVGVPGLGPKEVQLTARALRQFFLVHLRARGQRIVMPSKAADALWHAFILDTRAYASFCTVAFGALLHHIPERAMAAKPDGDDAAWRTWRLACEEENINPARATRLPLLYALDVKLGWPGAVVHDPQSFRRRSDDDGCGGGSDSSRHDAADSASGGDGDGGGGGCGGD